MTESIVDAQTDCYRVDLECFNGPLDLLLYLIKQEEVDIWEIPIARITRQYLKYIEMMKTLDLEVAGEFILMAATLIRIKTRLLLPQDDTESDEPDPREELIMALVEYKKYKEAGEILRQRSKLEEQFYVPPSPVQKIDGKIDFEPATSLYDLVVAFKQVISTKHPEIIHEVNPEEVAIEDRMLVVLNFMKEHDWATFTELFADVPRKMVAIVTFIALLELTRSRRVRLHQAVPFSEMRISRGDQADAPHREIDLVEAPVTEE